MSPKKFTRWRLEINAIADLVVLEALSADWQAIDPVCERVGIPLMQGRRTAVRLAAAGAIEQRRARYLADKSRWRERFEYRLTTSTSWQRYPQWMEPPLHPIPTCARRVHGRNTISKEYLPMTEQELFELPRGVRERFREMSDEQFADHPEVASLRARLADLEAEHREAAARHHKLTNQKRGLEHQAEWARGEAARLADSRPRRLAEILLSGDHDLAQDRSTLAQIADLHHFSDVVALAMPQVVRIIGQSEAATRQIVQSMEGLDDAYRGLLDKLKLAEAERLAYA